jgi:hypothetical protein
VESDAAGVVVVVDAESSFVDDYLMVEPAEND